MSTASDDAALGKAIEALANLPLQQLRCYRIDAELRELVAIEPHDLAGDLRETCNELWIDIQAGDPREFREFLETLELHPLILEDCLDPYRSSRFSSFATSLHFEFPVSVTDSVDNYLSVICVPRLLITIRTAKVFAVDELLRDFDKEVQLMEGTKAALLQAILDSLVDCLLESARGARAEIRQMSYLMDSNADAIDIEEVISVKRRLQDITTIAEEQLYCLRSLVAVDSKALPISHQRDYLRDAVRNFETALRVLHRHESRGTELHQQFLLSLQSRTESRIRILTILSAVCMPLTLIAGIYGMNFDRMPELHSNWGYPLTLLLMVFIAIGQLIYFHRRGWFG